MKEPGLTKKTRALCAMVTEEHGAAISEVIVGIERAVSGMGKLPKKLNEELWDIVLTFFRKILTSAMFGETETAAKKHIEEIMNGIEGPLKKALDNARHR